MRYEMVLILICTVTTVVATPTCDRSWLIEQVYSGPDILKVQSSEPICTTPPQNYSELEAAVNTAYKALNGRGNDISLEDLAREIRKNGWNEEMRLAWYGGQIPLVGGPEPIDAGKTIFTVSLNRYGNWEVNNINLPPSISGVGMPIECDAGYIPGTGKVTVISKVTVNKVEKFNAAS